MSGRAKRTDIPAPAASASGRPSYYGERMDSHTVRLTKAQADKLARLGGGAWIRERIDRAKD